MHKNELTTVKYKFWNIPSRAVPMGNSRSTEGVGSGVISGCSCCGCCCSCNCVWCCCCCWMSFEWRSSCHGRCCAGAWDPEWDAVVDTGVTVDSSKRFCLPSGRGTGEPCCGLSGHISCSIADWFVLQAIKFTYQRNMAWAPKLQAQQELPQVLYFVCFKNYSSKALLEYSVQITQKRSYSNNVFSQISGQKTFYTEFRGTASVLGSTSPYSRLTYIPLRLA